MKWKAEETRAERWAMVKAFSVAAGWLSVWLATLLVLGIYFT